MADIPREILTAAAVAIHDADCPDRHCSGSALGHSYKLAGVALAAAAGALRAQGAAAERERISNGAEDLKFTLHRPGYGPAQGTSLEVVPLAELLALIGGER